MNPPFLLDNAEYPIDTQTYEHSGLVIHPDIIYFPNGFQGGLSQPYTHIMAMTPYNGSNTENPSIIVSNNPQINFIGDNIPNPLVPQPKDDHNSDVDMVYKDGMFYLYYRDSGGYANIQRKQSADLVHWDTAQSCCGLPPTLNISPAIIYDEQAQRWKMWLINDNICQYYESADGLGWQFIGNTDMPRFIPIKDNDQPLWHIDVQKMKLSGKYYALICYGNLTKNAYLIWAESDNGVNWTTYLNPVLSPPTTGWDSTAIYRSTFYIYDGEIVVFYSGKVNAWRIGYTKKRLDFIEKIDISCNVIRKE